MNQKFNFQIKRETDSFNHVFRSIIIKKGNKTIELTFKEIEELFDAMLDYTDQEYPEDRER